MIKRRGLLWLVTLIAILALMACSGGKDGDGASKSNEGITLKFVH